MYGKGVGGRGGVRSNRRMPTTDILLSEDEMRRLRKGYVVQRTIHGHRHVIVFNDKRRQKRDILDAKRSELVVKIEALRKQIASLIPPTHRRSNKKRPYTLRNQEYWEKQRLVMAKLGKETQTRRRNNDTA